MKVPHWLQEALNKRIDELSYKFQESTDIIQLQSRSDLILKQVVESMHPEVYKAFLEWEEQLTSINAMQSEWLYMRGCRTVLNCSLYDFY